jgi:MOSC domain-containing protein YiiM
MNKGKVIAVCSSKNKGTPKKDIVSGFLQNGFGLEGDAHGGDWHRQISLLGIEQIQTMKDKGYDVKAGSFAENITTSGLDHSVLKIGDVIKIGEIAAVEITQIGKECHTRCAIFNKIGECIMPEKGIFAKVVHEGPVKTGDDIEVVDAG